jgi:putative ABC transport system permease protein
MSLLFDLTYAWRLTRNSLGYSLMCASVVALGVGLTLWTYSVAYDQMWRPLGFPGSDRWYSVEIASNKGVPASPSVDAYTYQELLKHNRSGDYLGAFEDRAVVLSEGQVSTSLRAAAITPRLLSAAKVPPSLGRGFEDADNQPGSAPVAILSYATWQNFFSGDPAIIGKTARFDSSPVQIVGVMPKTFYEFADFELWVPLPVPNTIRPSDSTRTFSPLILLGKHQNLNTVLNEMKSTVADVNSDYPNLFKPGRHPKLLPAVRMFYDDRTPILTTMSFMSVAVCLLGCVDISMMFLARLLERSRELALRTALGASRFRLLAQCLLETALIVPVGLIGGYALAAVAFHWEQGLDGFTERVLAGGRPPYVPALEPIYWVIAVCSAVTIWLLSTLLPAWRIANQDAALVLAGSGKGSSLGVSSKWAGALVGLQVVITCLVLVVCGNMVLGVKKELSKPTGLNTTNVMLSTDPTVFGPRFSEPAQRLRYWEDLSAAIQSKLPGAEAAFTTAAPTRPDTVAASIETEQGTEHRGKLKLPLTVVSDNYFQMLGMSLRSGRLFDSTDNGNSLKVAVVDEQLAARYWPNQDVLGKRVQLNPSENSTWLTIVGVVSVAGSEPYSTDVGVIYQPLRQAVPSSFQVLAKVPNTGNDTRAALRAAAFEVDRDLPLHNLQTLNEYLTAIDLGYASLIPAFLVVAVMTAVLATAGLYGLISRSVAQRTQEVGIRRALGATSWGATSMFLRQGGLYLCVGLVGIVLGTMAATVLSTMIPNILAHVALVTLGVVFLMAMVIFAASYLPSRHAVRLEPGDALRYE